MIFCMLLPKLLPHKLDFKYLNRSICRFDDDVDCFVVNKLKSKVCDRLSLIEHTHDFDAPHHVGCYFHCAHYQHIVSSRDYY